MPSTQSIQDMMSLKGRVAVVTGGAGHLGRTICTTLAELGASVAIVDRQDAVRFAKELAGSLPVETFGMEVDLEDEAATRSIPDTVKVRFGRCEVLVNNAAFVGTSNLEGWAVPFSSQSAETWRRAIEVNLTAAFVLSQAFVPLLTRDKASIINIASIYGSLGPDWSLYQGTAMGNPAAYAVSKGGLLQLTRWLATTLAPGIRVNAISPGGIERGQSAAFVERYNLQTPMRRMAREDDLKGAIAFLAGDASRYVTGQNLLVDGGRSVW